MTTNFQSQSLEDWLFYLEQQHPSEIELGLNRVKLVAQEANLYQFPNSKIVLVAGTNGKGTTIRFMEQYLLASGFSVGVYSSPHMFTYHERVRINGQHLADQEHIDAFSCIEQNRGTTPLTYFEFGTLAGIKLLQQAELDYVLIEVGLGGRLDATNILNHDLSIITSIGLDHIDWLGETLEKIAFEKAGIFRKNKPVVIGEPKQYDAFIKQIEQHQVSRVQQFEQDYFIKQTDKAWSYQSESLNSDNLTLPLIPVQNISTAITALLQLEIQVEKNKIEEVLSNLSLPGRMQLVNSVPMQMVDVAHNSHALNYLINTIENNQQFEQITKIDVVIAMMKDKDIAQTLKLLMGKVNNWYLADLENNPRAAKAIEIADLLHQQGEKNVMKFESIKQAWAYGKSNQVKDSLLLGFGSFYTVAEILSQTEV